jgi:phosphoribosylamine--glycine ligase
LKVLIVGGGGREHALAWRLHKLGSFVLVASPGNPGLARLGKCLPAPPEVAGYAAMAEDERVDLTIVGPEAPLVAGIADEFHLRGLPIVGPTRAAAQLEGSKVFAKKFFARAGIPTARSMETATTAEAVEALRRFSLPVVIKADGLAAGKGVVIAHSAAEAESAVEALGPSLVIEEFLEGEEVSFIGLSNGRELLPLEASQDHKRIGDGDTGPNTGGMGAYSDSRILTSQQTGTVMETVMLPAIRQMQAEGTPFRGFLYAGLMMTAEGPKVLEFNVRMGDPETQAILHRWEAGFAEALEFAAGLGPMPKLSWSSNPSVCVVLAAEGYPKSPVTGDVIEGLEAAEQTGAVVFHAGTKNGHAGAVLTAGGRVLGVTASGETLPAAIHNAYEATAKIHFRGMQYRHDIGAKGLRRWHGSEDILSSRPQ